MIALYVAASGETSYSFISPKIAAEEMHLILQEREDSQYRRTFLCRTLVFRFSGLRYSAKVLELCRVERALRTLRVGAKLQQDCCEFRSLCHAEME